MKRAASARGASNEVLDEGDSGFSRRRLLTRLGTAAGAAGIGLVGLESARPGRASAAVKLPGLGSPLPVTPLTPSPADAIRYVSTSGDDGSSGLTWGEAKKTLQAAIDSLPAQTVNPCDPGGGGTVYLGAGTFVASAKTTLPGKVNVIGAGMDSTILAIADGVNDDVLQSSNFLTDTGKSNGAQAGIFRFSIRDLTIDGNKANQTAGSGVRLMGADYTMSNVRIRNCHDDGLYSEWNYSWAGLANELAQLWNVRASYNGRDGISWNGPNDSRLFACEGNHNGRYGLWNSPRATGGGGGLFCFGCHCYGNEQTHAFRLDQSTSLIGCEGEGASTGQVLVLANGCEIWGGGYYNAGTSAGYAIQLGGGDRQVMSTKIRTSIGGVYAAVAALQLANEVNSDIEITHALPTAGNLVAGSFQQASKYVFVDQNTGYLNRFHLGGDTAFYSQGREYTDRFGPTPPSISASAQAGSGAKVWISGTDKAGSISVTTGSAPAANGELCKVTFGRPYTGSSVVVHLTPMSAAAAKSPVFADVASYGNNAFALLNAGKPAAKSTLTFAYRVIGIGMPAASA